MVHGSLTRDRIAVLPIVGEQSRIKTNVDYTPTKMVIPVPTISLPLVTVLRFLGHCCRHQDMVVDIKTWLLTPGMFMTPDMFF